jgi:uncharacterized membrane protein
MFSLPLILMAIITCLAIIFTTLNFYHNPTTQHFIELLVCIVLYWIFYTIKGHM